MDDIKIIKAPDSQKPYAVIYKPAGLPSAPLSKDDENNAFSRAAQLFPDLLQVNGKKEIEHGLIHRLDTATKGLILIAATQECYDYLIEQQKQDKILKTYTAQCDIHEELLQGFPESPVTPNLKQGQTITESSYFRPYGEGRKQVRPVTQDSSKTIFQKIGKQVLYTTNIIIKEIDLKNKTASVECTISNGFRHQVRCHLAWCGLPVKGDKLYNPAVKNESTEPLQFCAEKIQFEYPRGDLNSYDRKDTWT